MRGETLKFYYQSFDSIHISHIVIMLSCFAGFEECMNFEGFTSNSRVDYTHYEREQRMVSQLPQRSIALVIICSIILDLCNFIIIIIQSAYDIAIKVITLLALVRTLLLMVVSIFYNIAFANVMNNRPSLLVVLYC